MPTTRAKTTSTKLKSPTVSNVTVRLNKVESSTIDQTLTKTESVNCTPEEKKKEIRSKPCGGCLLVHKSCKPTPGLYENYEITDERAVEIRHQALVESIKFLREARHEVESSRLFTNLEHTEVTKKHSDQCVLCHSPCPLCGRSLENCEDYAIRCRRSLQTSSMRLRKRKIGKDESPNEEQKAKKATIPQTIMAVVKPLSKTQEKPSVAINPTATNVVTFLSNDGTPYKFPVLSGEQVQPFLLNTGKPNENSNKPVMTVTLKSSPCTSSAHTVSKARMVTAVVPQHLPTFKLQSVAANVKNAEPVTSQPPLQPIVTCVRVANSQDLPSPNNGRKHSMATNNSSSTAGKPVANLVTSIPAITKNKFKIQSNASSQVKYPAKNIVLSKTTSKKPVPISPAAQKPVPHVEFGVVPRKVAETFHKIYYKNGSLTGCIRMALSVAPLLKYKYKFMKQDLSSENSCILIGLLSANDVKSDLDKELKNLDEFVKDNHLNSRASALEELLFSPLQCKETLNNTDLNKPSELEGLLSSLSQPKEAVQPGMTTNTSASHLAAPKSGVTPRIEHNEATPSPQPRCYRQKTNKVKDWWCKACNKMFGKRYHYERHCKSASHRFFSMQKEKKKAKLSAFKSKTSKIVSSETTTRNIWSASVKRKNEPENSKRVIMRKKPPESPSEFSALLHQSFQSMVALLDTSKRRIFKCYICNQVNIAGEDCFLKHLWSHGALFNHSCAWCGLKFEDATMMQLHITKKNCDMGVKKKTTSLTSNTIGKLTGYTGIVPQHYKPFSVFKQSDKSTIAKCSLCPFSAPDINSITYHARKHVGDYPYRCSKCVFGSVSKHLLVLHQNKRSHEGFYVIRRSAPLSIEEKKKMEEIVRQKFHFNEKGYVEDSKQLGSDETSWVLEFQDLNDHEEYVKKTETNLTPDKANTSKHETKETKNTDEDSWLFCKTCNSAFLDKGTFDDHKLECKQGASIWKAEEKLPAHDERTMSDDDESHSKRKDEQLTNDSSLTAANLNDKNSEEEIETVRYKKGAKLENLSDRLLASRTNFTAGENLFDPFSHAESVKKGTSSDAPATSSAQLPETFGSRRSRSKAIPQKINKSQTQTKDPNLSAFSVGNKTSQLKETSKFFHDAFDLFDEAEEVSAIPEKPNDDIQDDTDIYKRTNDYTLDAPPICFPELVEALDHVLP
ncbi:unnamed protein product [Clavelina lepadiformis]|uniref:C2H2-type domain-containing protein n=1 Tax=Clavelina lepadiformis TaxID=159417 RepID=A0ABP0FZH4_CLALP